jgi:hypothetical protein
VKGNSFSFHGQPYCGLCGSVLKDGETFRVVNISGKGSLDQGPMPAHPTCSSDFEAQGYKVEDAPSRPEGT